MKGPGIRAWAPIAASAALLACTPTLDWRDVRPPGSGLLLQFPCRPGDQVRRVALAGVTVALHLYACRAGDLTWGLSFAEVGDAASVEAALVALRRASKVNVQARESRVQPLLPAGATPSAASLLVVLKGHRPDGQAVEIQTAVFARGTRVFQATALGQHLPADAVGMFFSSLRLER